MKFQIHHAYLKKYYKPIHQRLFVRVTSNLRIGKTGADVILVDAAAFKAVRGALTLSWLSSILRRSRQYFLTNPGSAGVCALSKHRWITRIQLLESKKPLLVLRRGFVIGWYPIYEFVSRGIFPIRHTWQPILTEPD